MSVKVNDIEAKRMIYGTDDVVKVMYRGEVVWKTKVLLPSVQSYILTTYGQTVLAGILSIINDNPTLAPIINDNPTLAPIINDNPTLAPIINDNPTLAPIVVLDNGIVPFLISDTDYLLDSSDALVGGKWVDRFNPNIAWTPTNASLDTDKGYYLKDTSNYFSLTNGNLYNLGNHWRVDMEVYAIFNVAVDFGSVANANKNIRFYQFNEALNFSLNWKMLGNNSTPSGSTIQTGRTITGHHYLSWEITDAGNGYDKFVARIDGVAYEGDYNIPKANQFGGYNNWDIKSFYIGRGVSQSLTTFEFYLKRFGIKIKD